MAQTYQEMMAEKAKAVMTPEQERLNPKEESRVAAAINLSKEQEASRTTAPPVVTEVSIPQADRYATEEEWAKAMDHVENLRSHAMQFLGQVGMNPYCYMMTILPLCRDKLYSNVQLILKLQKEEPTIRKFWKHPLTAQTLEDVERARLIL